MNNVITASRMNGLINCPRSHFWSYEVGLTKDDNSPALRFGSAWHRAMEERWKGGTYDQALALAIPQGVGMDEYACAVLAALLAAYYDYYGPIERVGKINPEIQFDFPLEDGFSAQGKIDGLGSMRSGRSALIESKTTSDSIEPQSDYWIRLRFNVQVLNYTVAARVLGWDVAEVYYDVTKKPMLKPKEICSLDSKGRKIVVDKNGTRIYRQKKQKFTVGNGKKAKEEIREVDDLDKPRLSGDEGKGWVVKSHIETPDEYCDRLWRDAKARPEFYFKRQEIAIPDGDIEKFENHRKAMVRLIQHYRSQESDDFERDAEAWPRNISTNTCKFCRYQSFCLQNISIDINNPPEGFEIKPFNPELEKYETTNETTGTDAAA
jgi:hypothetical protein